MTCNLVCLPGFMCDASLFDPMAAHLTTLATGDRVSLHHGDVYSDPSIAGMAARVLAEAPERFALLGFSMGGFVARAIALAAPDRVTHLILVATSARATSPAEHARKRELLAQLDAHGFSGMSRRALARAIHDDHPDREVLVERLRDMGARLGGEVMANQLQAVREDGHADLPKIRIPALVIAARNDKLRPLKEVEALATGLPEGRFEVLDDCGHMLPMEKPAVLAGLVTEFLGR